MGTSEICQLIISNNCFAALPSLLAAKKLIT